jgi:hypothetical protein
MADYFMCLDAETFLQRIRPALTNSWHQRSFDPCRSLCGELLPAVQAYAQRYHLSEKETLVATVADGIPFDRVCWRHLAGEVILFAAAEIPEFPSNAEPLCCLLGAVPYHREPVNREYFAPIEQILRGSRDLIFGTAMYRPDQAGYNDPADVARLAAYLTSVQPQRWTVEDLQPLSDLVDDEERADELEFVREWYPALVELYQRTHENQRVLIIENIY